MDVSVIIVAAGKSTRTNGIDKNFVTIGGKFIVEFSLDVFLKLDSVQEIILVLNEYNYRKGEELAKKYQKINIVKGGDFRAASVKNGVEVASKEFILVHDGARPFINISLVQNILATLESYNCVIPVVPVRHTIKEVENGFVKSTLDRTKIYEVQTPEGFRRSVLLDLYKRYSLSDSIFDESILFEMANIPVKAVPGFYENFKITTPFDIFVAEMMVHTWRKE